MIKNTRKVVATIAISTLSSLAFVSNAVANGGASGNFKINGIDVHSSGDIVIAADRALSSYVPNCSNTLLRVKHASTNKDHIYSSALAAMINGKMVNTWNYGTCANGQQRIANFNVQK